MTYGPKRRKGHGETTVRIARRMALQGTPLDAIGERLGVSHNTVKLWCEQEQQQITVSINDRIYGPHNLPL